MSSQEICERASESCLKADLATMSAGLIALHGIVVTQPEGMMELGLGGRADDERGLDQSIRFTWEAALSEVGSGPMVTIRVRGVHKAYRRMLMARVMAMVWSATGGQAEHDRESDIVMVRVNDSILRLAAP